jgi:hypothetical protein
MNITIGELFTLEETKLAAEIFNKHKDKGGHILHYELATQVVDPALSRINALTKQINDARYLAYALEYAMTQAANSPRPKEDQQ